MKDIQFKKAADAIKEIFRLMTWDWTALLLFEVLYKVLLLVLFQFGQDLLLYSVKISGIEYLTNQNVFSIIKNPVSAAGFLVFFILLIYFSFVEITAVILYCQCGAEGKKVKISRLFIESGKKASAVFVLKNSGMIILLLLMMPLSGLVLMSGPLSTLKIPGFILQFVYDDRLLGTAYFAVTGLLLFLLIQWIFSMQEFITNKCSFNEARLRSSALVKKRRIRTFLYILSGIALSWLTGAAVKIFTVSFLLAAVKLTNHTPDAKNAFWFMYHNLAGIGNILFIVLRTVCLHSVIMYVYCRYERKEIFAVREKKSWKQAARMAVQAVAAFICIGMYTEMMNPYQNEFRVQGGENIHIVAHRAGALFAPENTAAALREAVNSGAHIAEIDVQQTRDKVLVVMHDTDFKRIAGVDKKIWETDYEEAAAYDIGGYLFQGFEGERLPTLEEMIKEADGKIGLMIELKSSGHEAALEEKTVEIIRKHNFESQCSIASLDYGILEKIKEIAPDLKTVYIAAIAFGDLSGLPAADAVSIEESFIDAQLLAQARSLGKEVYAWTINSEKQMKRLMEMKVDGIVTDNAYFTSYILNTRGRAIWVEDLADLVFGAE